MTGPRNAGFALGVDLGTSNTVAVVRWPDGRTRPLLFDGLPVMPSGVYLHTDGQLYVGRDAHRLAQADPGRYEPNPKRRIDEPAVLLGDREVSTVDLLAAVLTVVARTAVEVTGFLPPAVLTYPASWGSRRRDVLAAAAIRAGWPPPHLVPEPVAAARYFVEILNRPVPVGSALAVFDFGGGTLDVAVVRNEGAGESGHPRFAVLGSGGIDELGGLDLDAALVDHLGGLLDRSAPDVWARLTRPASTVDLRGRRSFWDDVRGAKEMLSRSASAPVPVPGIDQAVHLTREELERLVTPLIRRGVFETAAVIGACGLRPDQLAGLFLVGGSSRVPAVARLLHAELGIAPTVLEQPELPVAEGALAELLPTAPSAAQAAPVSGPPVSPAPTMPGHTSGVPASPAGPTATATVPLSTAPMQTVPPPFAAPEPGAKRGRWMAALAAAAAVLLVLTGVGAWFLLRGRGDREVAFSPLARVGTVPMGDGASASSGAFAHVLGDRGYVAWQSGEKLQVIAIDLGKGTEKWRVDVNGSSDQWGGLAALPTALVVSAYDYSSSDPRTMYVLDPANGKELWRRDIHGDDGRFYFREVMVLADDEGAQLLGLDLRTGKQLWSQPYPKDQYDYTDATVIGVSTTADFAGASDVDGTPLAPDLGDDQRVVLVGVDQSVQVFDAQSGKLLKRRGNVAKPASSWFRAYDGMLYVAPEAAGYGIDAYDLNSLGEPRRIYTTTDSTRRLVDLAPCGSGRVCVLDQPSSDAKAIQLAAIDVPGAKQLWRKDMPGAELVLPVGDGILASRTGAGPYSVVLDSGGTEKFRRETVGARLNTASVLLFNKTLTTYADDTNLTGVGVRSAKYTELGEAKDIRSAACSWNASAVVCASAKEFVVWRFAGG